MESASHATLGLAGQGRVSGARLAHGRGRALLERERLLPFSPAEIEEIETATAQLYVLFLEAGDYVVRRGLFDLVTGADMR